ncbi:MAG: LysR family transcriptional regulator [Alphaproteobacteria bacterium]
MDWDRLRIFHAVAEAGSFTHAGETLNLSQSAVSRQISGLEDGLGLKLFHRHARGLLLTEQGEILFETAREVFAKVTLTESLLIEGKERPRGPLKVAATTAFSLTWIIPNLAEFLESYPEIDFTLIVSDMELDLSRREADVAVTIGRPSHPELLARRIMTIRHRIYASPEYLEAHGTPLTAEDLDSHRLIIYGEDAHPPTQSANWLRDVGARSGGRVHNIVRLNNLRGQLLAVERGVGIASMPDYIVHRRSNLVNILPQLEGARLEAYLTYPQELRNSMRIIVFRDFLLRKIAEAGGAA